MKDCFYVVIIIIIIYYFIIITYLRWLFVWGVRCVCVVVLVASGRQDRTRQID